MKIVNSRLMILFLAVLISFSQSCLIRNITENSTEKAALMLLTKDQQAVIKFVQQYMAEKPQAQVKELIDKGFLFKVVRYNIFVSGDPQKNDLEIETKITEPNSDTQVLFSDYKYFERCPKTDSEELFELMIEITYQLLKVSVISPFGTPI